MDEKSHHFKQYFGDVDILSRTNIHPKNPGHEHRQNQNPGGVRKPKNPPCIFPTNLSWRGRFGGVSLPKLEAMKTDLVDETCSDSLKSILVEMEVDEFVKLKTLFKLRDFEMIEA